jgi:hypothetical protein
MAVIVYDTYLNNNDSFDISSKTFLLNIFLFDRFQVNIFFGNRILVNRVKSSNILLVKIPNIGPLSFLLSTKFKTTVYPTTSII